MGTSLPEPLAQALRFDPDWIKDPIPWILTYLDRESAIGAALIRIEFQQSVHTAHIKALEQLQGFLKKQQRQK